MRKDRKKGTKDYDNKCGIANNCSSDYSGRDFFSSERKVLYDSGTVCQQMCIRDSILTEIATANGYSLLKEPMVIDIRSTCLLYTSRCV